jgi:hypothetical protein
MENNIKINFENYLNKKKLLKLSKRNKREQF